MKSLRQKSPEGRPCPGPQIDDQRFSMRRSQMIDHLLLEAVIPRRMIGGFPQVKPSLVEAGHPIPSRKSERTLALAGQSGKLRPVASAAAA
ncbi:hypothetical protein D3C80_684590 [compost metagenome]